MNVSEDVTPVADPLAGLALLRFAEPETRKLIEACVVAETYPFGATIVREGEESDAVYVVTSGRARVLKRGEHDEEVALGSLRPGDSFGELGVLEGSRRTATVRASSVVEVLRLERTVFQGLMRVNASARQAAELAIRYGRARTLLRLSSPLRDLTDEAMRQLLTALRPVAFTAGEAIVRQGDPAGSMFIVRDGRLRVMQGGQGTINYLRPGDFFGERALLLGELRSATVEAVTDGELLELDPGAFSQIQAGHADFHAAVQERVVTYTDRPLARVPLDFADELLPADAAADAELAEDLREFDAQDVLDGDPAPGARLVELPAASASAAEGVFTRPPRRLKRFPHVYQLDEADCGAAALTMVCRYFGRKISIARVRRAVQTNVDGTSLAGIARGAEQLGLAVRTVKASKRLLDELPLPAIAHWEGNHWIVVYDTDADTVRASDPARGLVRIPRTEFEEKWSGFAALLAPTAALQDIPEGGASLAWMLSFFKPHRATLARVAVLALAAAGLEMAIPMFSQYIVNDVIGRRDFDLLHLLVVAMVATLLLTSGVTVLQRYILSRATMSIDRDSLAFLARRMLSLPTHYFATRRAGDIDQRLGSLRQARQFYVNTGVGALTALAQLIVAFVLMLVLSPLLTLVFAAALPVYVWLLRFSSRRLRPIFEGLEDGMGRYRSRQLDSIRGIETVKAMAAEPALEAAMVIQFTELARRVFRSDFTMMLYQSAIQLVTFASLALFLWIGALQVLDHDLSVGAFVAFNALVLLANAPILVVLGAWDQAQYSQVVLGRLDDILSEEPEQGADRSHLRAVPTLEGHVSLRHVSFAYPGVVPAQVLEDVTLDIPAGTTVAIVGRSGSGKTTLAKLLAGLYEPTGGQILYDGLDIASLDYRQLRRHLGFVLQETHLFDESIAQNIALGSAGQIDVERVRWAARIAGAQTFIERLPLGYDTRVGESGLSLSGGQKQRIAIARAIYRRPAILILDEATSALDTESERAVQDGMDELRRDRTCFMIAHRLSTVRNADLIVVLDRGRLVERGTHDELVERRGLYYSLVSQQLDVD